jgi:hypothetical protein
MIKVCASVEAVIQKLIEKLDIPEADLVSLKQALQQATPPILGVVENITNHVVDDTVELNKLYSYLVSIIFAVDEAISDVKEKFGLAYKLYESKSDIWEIIFQQYPDVQGINPNIRKKIDDMEAFTIAFRGRLSSGHTRFIGSVQERYMKAGWQTKNFKDQFDKILTFMKENAPKEGYARAISKGENLQEIAEKLAVMADNFLELSQLAENKVSRHYMGEKGRGKMIPTPTEKWEFEESLKTTGETAVMDPTMIMEPVVEEDEVKTFVYDIMAVTNEMDVNLDLCIAMIQDMIQGIDRLFVQG